MPAKPNVLVSVPNQRWVHRGVVFALMALQRDARVQSTFVLPTHKPYINNLHKIINDFLKGDFDYWVSFDADNPPRNNIFDLVFLDKDIIGCPTPVLHLDDSGDWPIYWNALDEKPEGWTPHKITEGLQEVDAVGSGCIVVARRVLKAMRHDPPHQRWFFRLWNDMGEMERGGDYMFCKRAKARGFKVWTHYDYPAYHFNEVELGHLNQAYGGFIDG